MRKKCIKNIPRLMYIWWLRYLSHKTKFSYGKILRSKQTFEMLIFAFKTNLSNFLDYIAIRKKMHIWNIIHYLWILALILIWNVSTLKHEWNDPIEITNLSKFQEKEFQKLFWNETEWRAFYEWDVKRDM